MTLPAGSSIKSPNRTYNVGNSVVRDPPEGRFVSAVYRVFSSPSRVQSRKWYIAKLLEEPADSADDDYRYARTRQVREYENLKYLDEVATGVAPAPVEPPFHQVGLGDVLVVEDLGETDLAKFVRAQQQEGNDSPDKYRELLHALFQALQRLHTAGVIHRDLKPTHILLAKDGAPRFIDFDFATQEKDIGIRTAWRHEPLRPDDPYASPAQRLAPLDAARKEDDIFSLAASFYFVVTHRFPPLLDPQDLALWKAEKPEECAASSERFEAQLRQVLAGTKVDERTLAVLVRAMDLEKQSRFDSAEQVLRELEAHVEISQPASRLDWLPKQLGKSSLPRWRSAVLASAAIGLLWWQMGLVPYAQAIALLAACCTFGMFASLQDRTSAAKLLTLLLLIPFAVSSLSDSVGALGGCSGLFALVWLIVYYIAVNLRNEDRFASLMVLLISPFLVRSNLIAVAPLAFGLFGLGIWETCALAAGGFGLTLLGAATPSFWSSNLGVAPSSGVACSTAMLDLPMSFLGILLLPLLKNIILLIQALVWVGTAVVVAAVAGRSFRHHVNVVVGFLAGAAALVLGFYFLPVLSHSIEENTVPLAPDVMIVNLIVSCSLVALFAVLPRIATEGEAAKGMSIEPRDSR